MLLSTDVREDLAKWAKEQGIDLNNIVAYDTGSPPSKRKPGFTYKAISPPVDVPGMKFYQKLATSPPASLPNFGKFDPAPLAKSVDPKPRQPRPFREPEPKPTKAVPRTDSATPSGVAPKPPQPKPAKETKPSVTFGKAHTDKPKPSGFGRKGGKK